MPCIAIAVHPFNGCSRTWHQLFKSRIPSPQLLDATLTSYYIILHPPTSPRSMQYIYVRLYNIVTCSLVLDDYGNLEGSQLKALLTGLEAPPNSLNPLWKEIFCMTGWSHASPPMQHFKRYHNSTKKTESDSMIPSQHLSLWSKPRSRKSSWSIESVRNGDCLGFSEESEAKFSRTNIDPMFWETHFPPDGMILWRRETFNSSFHQSKSNSKETKKYLNI